MSLEEFGRICLVTLGFATVALIIFGVAFAAIVKLSPFSIRKELEEDQNTALGIVIGAVIIGIALILKGAISG